MEASGYQTKSLTEDHIVNVVLGKVAHSLHVEDLFVDFEKRISTAVTKGQPCLCLPNSQYISYERPTVFVPT